MNQLRVLTNLESRVIMGVESRGMLLAAGDHERVVFIAPEKDIESGSLIT